ncbi:MAG: ubiquinone/menaquinone biosynthesis methyltransferase [Phycisphaerae bacterium]
MDDSTDLLWDEDRLRMPHHQGDKADRVRRMFNAIAPTYERINRWFSGGRDGYWRRRAVELAGVGPGDVALDVACGSGDLARAMASTKPRRVIGCDFAHDMLRLARGRGSSAIDYCEADALALPLPDGSVTVTGCAFGARNFDDLQAGLSEMHRVLAPGGRAMILEFTRPTGLLKRAAYEVYAGWIMPVLASWVARDRTGAYRYLPRSVVCFADAEQMCRLLSAVGFVEIDATPLTFGVVTVYVARKASDG